MASQSTRDLNRLTTEGVTVTVKGSQRLFKGALLAFLSDNLAINELGGFKRSFSMSFRGHSRCHFDIAALACYLGWMLHQCTSHLNLSTEQWLVTYTNVL